jgi:hypothetical protein
MPFFDMVRIHIIGINLLNFKSLIGVIAVNEWLGLILLNVGLRKLSSHFMETQSAE